MKSNTLFKLILLTTILLMNLQSVVATASSVPTVRAPIPIGAVIASIAVMLLVTYRSRLS
ncbi:hypothetical protein KKP97_06595 [Methanothermococcus sp. SCGC AD-155-C09]|nr:hypothetical protein [Methanothermococcus sp. SCGC AD-155-C09]